MRARLARPRRIVRGRLAAPVAAAAAVALVGGMVVAAPDAPTVRDDVQTVALAAPSFNAGAEFSFNAGALVQASQSAGFVVEDVTGLPEGLEYDGNGGISGTVTTPGVYTIQVTGRGIGGVVTIPVTLTINNEDGSAPAGASGEATATVDGSLDGEAQAGGQITTGSDGTDAILGAVAGIVSSLGGDAGSVAELAAGSTGQGGVTPENPDAPDAPTGPLGSAANGELGLGSLSNGAPETPDAPDADGPGTDAPANGSLGMPGSTAEGEVSGDATGGLDTQSLGPLAPLGSLIDSDAQTGSTADGDTETTGSTIPGSTTTGGTQTGTEIVTGGDLTGGGEITVPGSSFPADTGSLGALAPGLALTGAALLGIAGLSLALGGGSSIPGSTAILPALPGSTTTGGTTTGGSSDTGNGGSSGSVAPTVAAGAPTVAAGAPNRVQAPGPTVANGRG
nr:hypothetical protein [Dietzia maris]